MKCCQTLYLINFDANSTFTITFTLALDVDVAGGSALYWSLDVECKPSSASKNGWIMCLHSFVFVWTGSTVTTIKYK